MNSRRNKSKFGMLALTAVLLISVSGCEPEPTPRPDPSLLPSSSTVSEYEPEPENINQPIEQDTLLYVTGVVETVSLKDSDDGGDFLTALPVKTAVKLIDDESMTCYFVEYNGMQGYVKKEYLTSEENAACQREESYISKNTSLYDKKSNGEYVEVLKINKNDKIKITAKTSGDYWFVYHEGSKQFGYVPTKDIADAPEVSSGEPETVSSAAPAPTPAPTPDPTPTPPKVYKVYYVSGVDDFLGLRNGKNYNSSIELAKMYEGEKIYVVDSSTGTFWYVYSPRLGMYGYSNKNYLSLTKPGTASSKVTSSKVTSSTVSSQAASSKIDSDTDSNTDTDTAVYYDTENDTDSVSSINNSDNYTVYTVTGTSNYLGLRNAASYDETNVIAHLSNGDKVYVYSTDVTGGDYWYVYSPTYNKYGYVNYNYLKK